MSGYAALTTTQYEIHVNGNAMEGQKVVEVQQADEVPDEVPSFFSVNLFITASNGMLSVYAPEPLEFTTDTYSLPVNKLHEGLETFQDWLYEHDIAAKASELIAAHVLTFVLENTDHYLDAVLSVKTNLEIFVPELRMDELKTNEEEEDADLGDCPICLEPIFDSQNIEVVKMPCKHVYHKPCILTWLNHSNSCPLCRAPLPLKDSGELDESEESEWEEVDESEELDESG